jgi:hypothetical protein
MNSSSEWFISLLHIFSKAFANQAPAAPCNHLMFRRGGAIPMVPVHDASTDTRPRFFFTEPDRMGALAGCVVQFEAQAQIVLL